jgi:DMATS type aromatic prenyltransferase
MQRAVLSATRVTYSARAREMLEGLATALSLPPGAGEAMSTHAHALLGDLADRGIPTRPPSPSAISDDSSPFELSVVLDPANPEIRILWESQSDRGTLAAKIDAGLATNDRLCTAFGIDQRRFDLVRDLFLPGEPVGAFAIWHASRLWPLDAGPELKVYLNPQIRGRLRAPALVEEALGRLGVSQAWRTIAAVMPRGPELDEILYFSLDLANEPTARTKIYLQHHDPELSVIRRVAAASPSANPEEVVEFWRAVTADRPAVGGFSVITSDRRPAAGVSPGSCLSFCGGATPSAVTIHVPVRSHVDNDAEACRRSELALGPAVGALHRATANAVRRRRLEDGVGLTSYLSLRSQKGKGRATAYLSSECFASLPARRTGVHPSVDMPALERMIDAYEAEPITLHPFFQRMAREPVDQGLTWAMFANAYVAISQHFPRRLAHVIATVDHEHIRCILAEQLYEELGNGNHERTHRKLFLGLLDLIAGWKPAIVPRDYDAPGRRLASALDEIYYDTDPYTGVGAAIVIELLGKQVDMFVADQFRRQQEVGLASLEWLTLHEALEVDHADESRTLGALIEGWQELEAAWRGGRRVFAAAWSFFDDMYAAWFR